jgi:hypothetical protein
MFRAVILSTMSVAASALLAAPQAIADDKRGYTLFNPTPEDKMRDFNTDRPTKSNVPASTTPARPTPTSQAGSSAIPR